MYATPKYLPRAKYDPAAYNRRVAIECAIIDLQRARDLLIRAGAKRSLARVRASLKSAEGALRHASRMEREAARYLEEQRATLGPDPIVTRPGESLIATVAAARQGEERTS